jgi:hypothetical protein
MTERDCLHLQLRTVESSRPSDGRSEEWMMVTVMATAAVTLFLMWYRHLLK